MGSPTALQLGHAGREADIVALFTATFTASEGAQEGALIGGLVRRLLAGTPPQDLFVFTAREGGEVVGAVVFSRRRYDARFAVVIGGRRFFTAATAIVVVPCW